MTSTTPEKDRSRKYFSGYASGDRGLRIQSQSYVEDIRRKRNPTYDHVAQLRDDENWARRQAATRRVRREEDLKVDIQMRTEADRKLKDLATQVGSRLDLNTPHRNFDFNSPLPPPPPSPRPQPLEYFDNSPPAPASRSAATKAGSFFGSPPPPRPRPSSFSFSHLPPRPSPPTSRGARMFPPLPPPLPSSSASRRPPPGLPTPAAAAAATATSVSEPLSLFPYIGAPDASSSGAAYGLGLYGAAGSSTSGGGDGSGGVDASGYTSFADLVRKRPRGSGPGGGGAWI
ncbi:hypothetical protein BT67DRAFT_458855 [Trichocladium antarcticum]|uniref:Uncharacterized protein n=1 Tax=Trichocladium antarcticum TaxID=1450529 RepID=A0AAN6ZA46_9PEZI|nr:hypothetical protein BT67DRAFT_458855 [Trichocladium antarcticum]